MNKEFKRNSKMIIINFSHPITNEQISEIENLTGETIKQILDVPVHFENQDSFLPQLEQLMSSISLDSVTLQTEPILVNLPSLSSISAMALTALHGLMGYFPPIIRMRRVNGGIAPSFEVAEIINLQSIRDKFRGLR